MKKCSYCRCEFEGSKCPNCGGSGKTISSESSFKKSSFMDTFTDNPSSFIRKESFNYDIFVYVKNMLLYFGWAVGILLSKIRRFI